MVRDYSKDAHNDKYVACLSGIQIALALTVNHLMKERKISHLAAIELLTDFKKCSWQHTDPIFDFYIPKKKMFIWTFEQFCHQTVKKQFVEIIK